MLGHGAGLGAAHRQEVAEGAVVLEFESGNAAGAALGGLLLGQPGVLVVELVAQVVQQRIHAVVDQAAFGEAQRRGVEQGVAQLGGQGLKLRPGAGQGLQRGAAGLGELGRQQGQALEAIGQGHQVAGRGAAGTGAAGQAFQVAHRPQQPAHRQPQGPTCHQLAHAALAPEDRFALHQRRLDPAPQAAAAHGGVGAIQRPEQGALQLAAQLGAGELQVAAGGGIEHQGIAGVPAGGQIQGHLRLAGAIEVVHQAAGGAHRQGQLAQPQAIEAGQGEARLEGGAGLRRLKGRAGQGCEPQGGRAPGGCGRQPPGPEQLGRILLQQLLVQGVAAGALGDPELAGAHVGHGQAPAVALQHHGAEPVVAAGGEHALLQHRAGGEHAGDLALEQFALGGCALHLVAEGHAVAAAHQLAAVALGGVVGDPRHRHPADRLAGLLAREGELQQSRGGDGVLEEALEEVAQPVEQQPLGVGGLELHVVAQHRRERQGLHQAVVVPGGQVGVGVGVAGAGVRGLWRFGARPVPWPGRAGGLLCRCRAGTAKQVALDLQAGDQRKLLVGFRGHGPPRCWWRS